MMRWVKLLLMATAALGLLLGLWAGLLRIGWSWPSPSLRLPSAHGPLMVTGFLGTLISLERAVALAHFRPGRRWAYLAPLAAGLSVVALLLGLPLMVVQALGVLGAAGLVVVFVEIYRLQPILPHAVMGLGAVLWLAGNLLWLAGRPIYQATPWWMAFLVLTVAGERLELSRIRPPGRAAEDVFLALVVGVISALLISAAGAFDAGLRLAGAGFLALAVWLLRYDLARYTVRRTGLTRYIAWCLLAGYVWLALSGGLMLLFGGLAPAGPRYDAMLHALFVGFVISMIFGHAPIIFPSLLSIPFVYTSALYAPLVLLHGSLALRIVADLAGNPALRRAGGLLNAIAILLFLGMMAAQTARGRRGAGNRLPGKPAAPAD